jgi:hypothetical protein
MLHQKLVVIPYSDTLHSNPEPHNIFPASHDQCLDKCFLKLRQLRNAKWEVGVHEDHSAVVTFPLAVKSMQLRFFLRIGEKLQLKLL